MLLQSSELDICQYIYIYVYVLCVVIIPLPTSPCLIDLSLAKGSNYGDLRLNGLSFEHSYIQYNTDRQWHPMSDMLYGVGIYPIPIIREQSTICTSGCGNAQQPPPRNDIYPLYTISWAGETRQDIHSRSSHRIWVYINFYGMHVLSCLTSP